jgi:hypothetical protein
MEILVSNSDEQILIGASSEPGISLLNQLNYTSVFFRLIVISLTISARFINTLLRVHIFRQSFKEIYSGSLTGAQVKISLVVLKKSNISLSK